MKQFTIIIPVYNEDELIVNNTEKLVKYLDKLKAKYEVIIGSNGSTDDTVKLGKTLAKKHKQIKFFHVKTRGVGYVFEKAVLEAKHDFIVSVDMDLSTDLGFIAKAVKLLEKNTIVVGSKKMGEQERSWLRLLPSTVFTFLTRNLLKLPYKDYSMAAKAYDRKFIKDYLHRVDHGTSYVIDIIFFAKKYNRNMIEIPVKCIDNRPSRFNLIHEVFYRFKNLIMLWLLE